ncbi:hypothetical protein D7030_00025 [Flavobacteriaceae bacterium AU392]|nr:hypothetical protein D1817_14410 [Flavobacteriaceae bacterium]RKM86920.1 hypothetical protein D7030_00025 [Flavobacteriaceae bacterium AU392]
MEDEFYKEIEAYLGGDMSSEVMLRFEKRILENKDLKKEVELYDDLNHYLGEKISNKNFPNNDYTKKLNEFLKSEEAIVIKTQLEEAKKKYHHKKSFFNKNKYVLMTSAAVILLMIILRVSIFPPNQFIDTLYVEYYNVNDLPSFVTRDDTQNKLSKGVLSFQNKKYKEALIDFEVYKKTSTEVDTLMFLYQGMSYLELDENDKAIEAFKIVSTSNILDRSKGLWFKALAYLKLKDEFNAKKLLEEIRSNSSNFKFKEAKELLDKLK